MAQKQIKILIAAVIFVALFGLVLNWGIKIYNQDQAAKLEKGSLAQWKERSLHEYLRKVEERLQKLEWNQMIIEGELAAPSTIPRSAANVINSSQQARHYFQNCKGKNFSKIKKGMSKNDIRALCAGHEYPAFETVKNGFCFALNDARSNFYTFVGWMPKMEVSYDFFVSDTDSLLYVRYDQQGNAKTVEGYPISKDQKLSPEQAGVEIKQINNKTLQVTITPR